MTINLATIGAKVKFLREKANLTQKQLAEYLSVDQSLISKFENGERSINSDALNKLADLFCCTVELLNSENSIQEYSISFRTTNLTIDDMKILATINRIALNQLKMERLARGGTNE